MWMRGGTSKGGYFLAEDLPADKAARDAYLLRMMGSPDARQIDGMGGADPLTSKVAIVSRSARAGADIDYLFLQVFVEQAVVSDAQNCGNILAGVAPFAIERGLIQPLGDETRVVIHMVNTAQLALAVVQTPQGRVSYSGHASIDGVPGQHAPVTLEFLNTAGSTCGSLLPTGNKVDVLDGVPATLIDNGMPCVVIRADAVGRSGYEDRETLDADASLKQRLETIRLLAGPLMNLGDVERQSVPKMMLVAPPRAGGSLAVRSFVPHRAHASIGVLGAVTVATACLLEGTPASSVCAVHKRPEILVTIEHPSGQTECVLTLDAHGQITKAALLRTARKLMDGIVFG